MPRRGGEFLGSQYTLYYDEIPIFSDRETGEPLLKASQSRLELAAQALNLPPEEVPNPRRSDSEPHWKLIRGDIMHRLVAATNAWRGCLPYSARNHRQEYLKNLTELLHEISTTQPLSFINYLRYVLQDERLALPAANLRFERRAIQANYRIMAEKAIDYALNLPPFTDTLPFPELNRVVSRQWELPFPRPDLVTRRWHETDQSGQIFSLTESLCEDQFGRFVPGQYLRINKDRPSPVVTIEHIISGRIGNTIWSARPDVVVWGSQPESPRQVISIEDPKFGTQLYDPESDTPQAKAMDVSAIATSALLAGIENHRPPRRIGIRKNRIFEWVSQMADTAVVIKHIGIGAPGRPIKQFGDPNTPIAPDARHLTRLFDTFMEFFSQILARADLVEKFLR